MDSWNNMTTGDSARRVISLCTLYRVDKLIIDAGYGATILSMLKDIKHSLKFSFVPVNFGGSPSNHYWTMEERTSKDKFLNARAEMFWMLRERFRKTYEAINGIREWDYSEMINIRKPEVNNKEQPTRILDTTPITYDRQNLSILDSQATVLTYEQNERGKIQIISKKKLSKSPDALDSLALAFYEVGKAKKANWDKY